MSEQVQNTTVITQKDLSKVIESVCQHIDAGTKIVTAMNSASITINKILGKNDITKVVSGLNKFKKNFDKYNLIIGSVLETVTKPMEGTQFKSFADLLGEIDDTDKEGKLTGKKRYTTVEAAQQIPNMISGAFKALESISAPNFAFNSARRIKKNMNVFVKTFDLTVSEIVKSFTQLNSNYDINKVLETLVKSPDVTISTIKNNITKDGIDKTKTGTRTTTGKLGLLDGLVQVFLLFETMNKLRPAVRAKKFERIFTSNINQMSYIISRLLEFSNNNIENIKKINEFTEALAKEDGISGLSTTFSLLVKSLVNTFNKKNIKQLYNILGKKDKNGKYKDSNIYVMSEVFNSIVNDIIYNSDINELADEKSGNNTKLSNVSKAINLLTNNIEALITFGKALSRVKRKKTPIIDNTVELANIFNATNESFKKISTSIEDTTISDVNKKLEEVYDEFQTTIDKTSSIYIALGKVKFKEKNKRFNKITLLLQSITNVFNNESVKTAIDNINSENIIQLNEKLVTIETTLPKLNNVLGGILVIAKQLSKSKRVLKRSVIAGRTLNILLNILENVFNNISKTIDDIIKVIDEKKLSTSIAKTKLILVGILSIVSTIIVINTVLIAGSPVFILGALASFLLKLAWQTLIIAIRLIVLGANKIKNTLARAVTGIGSITIIITLITLSMLMMAASAAIVLPFTGKILLFLLDYILIGAVIALLGYGLGLISAFIAPAIAGFAIILAMVACLAATALALKALTLIDLDKNAIKESVSAILGAAKAVIDGIFSANTDVDLNGDGKVGPWEKILSFIGGTVGTMIKAILSVRFLALAMVSIGIIMILAIQLRILQMLNLDTDKIKETVRAVVTTVNDIINIIFFGGEEPEEKPTAKTWLMGLLNFIGGSIVKIAGMILAVRFLATAISAICMVMILAIQLRVLQMLNLKPDKIKATVSAVVTAVNDIINIIFNGGDNTSNEGSDKHWLLSVIEFVGGPIVKIGQAILSIRYLALSIGAVLLVSILAKQLNGISKVELDNNISDKVRSIILAANQVTTALFNRKDETNSSTPNEKKKGFLSKVFSGLGNAVDMIASLPWLSTAMVAVGMVSKLAEGLTTINNIPDVSNITSKTEAVCNAADDLIKHLTTRPETGGDIESNSRIDIIDKINQSIQSIGNIEQKQVKKIDKVFDDYSNFIDKVNTVDITKLETSTRMFEQMANFSNSIQGNFKQLAAALNENLMPVLQELKEIMEAIPEKLDTGFQNTSASIAATTVAPTQETVTAQVNRENPTMTKKEIDNIVQQRMKDYSQNEANGVTAKLDQLIDLLKGYSGENVMVKTI